MTVEAAPLSNTPVVLVLKGVPVPVIVRVLEPVPRLKVAPSEIFTDVSVILLAIVRVPPVASDVMDTAPKSWPED